MGQSLTISHAVEMQASPARVRSVFMDFPRHAQWSPWTIEPFDSRKRPSDLKAGDRLKVDMTGMVLKPTVLENSTDRFQWEASFYGLISGKHTFYFSPSTENPGGTEFVQTEDLRGPLALLLRPWSGSMQKALDERDTLSSSLKKEAEKPSSYV